MGEREGDVNEAMYSLLKTYFHTDGILRFIDDRFWMINVLVHTTTSRNRMPNAEASSLSKTFYV